MTSRPRSQSWSPSAPGSTPSTPAPPTNATPRRHRRRSSAAAAHAAGPRIPPPPCHLSRRPVAAPCLIIDWFWNDGLQARHARPLLPRGQARAMPVRPHQSPSPGLISYDLLDRGFFKFNPFLIKIFKNPCFKSIFTLYPFLSRQMIWRNKSTSSRQIIWCDQPSTVAGIIDLRLACQVVGPTRSRQINLARPGNINAIARPTLSLSVGI